MDVPSKPKRYVGAEREYVLDTQALIRYCSGARLNAKTHERVVRVLRDAGHTDDVPASCCYASPELRFAFLAIAGDRRRRRGRTATKSVEASRPKRLRGRPRIYPVGYKKPRSQKKCVQSSGNDDRGETGVVATGPAEATSDKA